MKNETSMTTLIGLLVVLVIAAGLLLALSNTAKQNRIISISSFEECALAGYPIMEKYPEECMTPDGRTFVRDVSLITPDPIIANGCAIAGCSGQLCLSEEDVANGVISTCEWRAEYACYQEASCERQSSGRCGWTETNELKKCLKNPPALE